MVLLSPYGYNFKHASHSSQYFYIRPMTIFMFSVLSVFLYTLYIITIRRPTLSAPQSKNAVCANIKVDTSIKHRISGQPSVVLKGCMGIIIFGVVDTAFNTKMCLARFLRMDIFNQMHQMRHYLKYLGFKFHLNRLRLGILGVCC